MSKLKQSFLIITIGLALATGLSYAWTGPTANPPNNNAPAPINVSNDSQIKTGPLQVNGFKNIGSSVFMGKSSFFGSIGIGIDPVSDYMLTANGSILSFNGNVVTADNNWNTKAALLKDGRIYSSAGDKKLGSVLTSDGYGNGSWAPPQMQTVGAGGLSGYEVKTVAGNGLTPVIAYCSGSKKILGGGCRPPTNSGVYLTDDYPMTTGENGWVCGITNSSVGLMAYAICAN